MCMCMSSIISMYIYIASDIYIYISLYLIYNSVGVEKTQIVQFANSTNKYLGKKSVKKEKTKNTRAT